MSYNDISIIVSIAALAAFFMLSVALKYAVADTFARTRLVMTSFFVFIVFTLTISFLPYAVVSLPYAVPALVLGVVVGYFAAAKVAQERLALEGLEHYIEHFTHVHLADVATLQWWSVANVYSVAAALILINLVGLSNVIFAGRESWALATCAVGAFLVGAVVPYFLHLWRLSARVDVKPTNAATPTQRTQAGGPKASL